MGWLVRYTGKKGRVQIPGGDEQELKKGQILDLRPSSELRAAVADKDAPFERIPPSDPDYVPAGERS